MAQPLPIFFHSNRPTRPPPKGSGFEPYQGHWTEQHTVDFKRTKTMVKTPGSKYKWLQGYKFHFLFDVASTSRRFGYVGLSNASSLGEEPWLMVDADAVVQCSALELKRRWRSLGKPLVISAEKLWYPTPNTLYKYPAAASGFQYPNTGCMMGTPAAFAHVVRLFDLMFPSFPCCHLVRNGRPGRNVTKRACVLDDQGCMQQVIQAGHLVRDRSGAIPFQDDLAVLDTNTSLFLNLDGVMKDELVSLPDGRFMHKPTGAIPCVVHANGGWSKRQHKDLDSRAKAAGWVVDTRGMSTGF